ncbi:MAG: MFS transporter [Planctomycetes bacterium]|nr:MFS transporter [Planctomycetota bacterium]
MASPLEDKVPTAAAGGLRTFSIVAIGQLISLFGSSLTVFAVGIWVYQETNSVTLLSLVILAGSLPGILVAPLAGMVVDRADRRLVMLVSDTAAGLTTMVVAGLILTDHVRLGHIFVLAIVGSLANAFQEPAYMASIPLLVPKQHLGRAGGFVQFSQGLARVLTPVLAGVMIVTVGIGIVLLTDVITFLVAVTALLLVRIPRPAAANDVARGEKSLLRDAVAGWSYVRERTGLMALLLLFTFVNFLVAFVNVLYIPLVLSFASPSVLGGTLTTGGVGMMIGSIAVMALGTPRRKVRGIMGLIFVGGIVIALSGVYPSAILIAANGFVMMTVLPFLQATSQVLWQTKVAPVVQGRVFALRRMLQQASLPAAYLLAGPLADHVFEPLLVEGGALSTSLGLWMGVGPGRGIGLLFVIMGIAGCLAATAGYLYPRIRNLETELPDMVH